MTRKLIPIIDVMVKTFQLLNEHLLEPDDENYKRIPWANGIKCQNPMYDRKLVK